MRFTAAFLLGMLIFPALVSAAPTNGGVSLSDSKSWHDAINAFPNPKPTHWGTDTVIGHRMNLLVQEADVVEEFRDLLAGLRMKIKNATSKDVAMSKKAIAVDCIDNIKQSIPGLINSLKSVDEQYGIHDVHQYAGAIGFNALYEVDKQSPNLKPLYRYWHKSWDLDRRAKESKSARYSE